MKTVAGDILLSKGGGPVADNHQQSRLIQQLTREKFQEEVARELGIDLRDVGVGPQQDHENDRAPKENLTTRE